MTDARPLADVHDRAMFGAKAAGLGQAMRAGIAVPAGVALSGPIVEAVAAGEAGAIGVVDRAVRGLHAPFAVRSSALDEDGDRASFAGQHRTLLNVASPEGLASALGEVWRSASSDAVLAYRHLVGLDGRPGMAAIVQELLDPDVAGVMFTRHPVSGVDERVVEASWGLGEAVVAGLVRPDRYRISRTGEVLERRPGRKVVAIHPLPSGGCAREDVAAALAERLCLRDADLARLHELASRCEEVFGPDRDIEWALAGGRVHLLQSRAITGL